MKPKPVPSIPTSPSSSNIANKTKAITVERLQSELDDRDNEIYDLRTKLHDKSTEEIDSLKAENILLKAKLEQTEHLLSDCRAQLHTQTLHVSATNSKNHLSEIELEKVRSRLLKRIEELDPLPELLKQAEAEKEKLQTDIDELRKRVPLQSNLLTQLPLTNTTKFNDYSPNDEIRTLKR